MQVDTHFKSKRRPIRFLQILFFLLDILVILAMGYCIIGKNWLKPTDIRSDIARYECYAVAFAHGDGAFQHFPPRQCAPILSSPPKVTTDSVVASLKKIGAPGFIVQFVASQSPEKPYHYLPLEYPILALLPFALAAIIANAIYYQIAFACLMALIAVGIYLVLLRYKSRTAALSFALWMMIGYLLNRFPDTATGRFDLMPGALTLIALVFAMKSRWNWAFAFLSLATFTKFYPVLLLLPFLIAQQQAPRYATLKWNAWRRLGPLATFGLTSVVIVAISLLLSVAGTLNPLTYFGDRPIQVESFQASLLWLVNGMDISHLSIVYTFGSLNVLGNFDTLISLANNALLAVGMLYLLWLQWRGKLSLPMASILLLMLVTLTGKVFSPQYVYWLFPVAAYAMGERRGWIVAWAAFSLLTVWIYPVLYETVHAVILVAYKPIFWQAVAIRNFLLFAMCIYAYGTATLHKPEPATDRSEALPNVGQPAHTDSGPIAAISGV